MVSCAACRHRRRGCGNQCPTRNLFYDLEEYRRVHRIFTYANIRRWMIDANMNNNGGRCAEALDWEARARTDDPVAGAYGRFIQAQTFRAQAVLQNQILINQNQTLINDNATLINQNQTLINDNATLIDQNAYFAAIIQDLTGHPPPQAPPPP